MFHILFHPVHEKWTHLRRQFGDRVTSLIISFLFTVWEYFFTLNCTQSCMQLECTTGFSNIQSDFPFKVQRLISDKIFLSSFRFTVLKAIMFSET